MTKITQIIVVSLVVGTGGVLWHWLTPPLGASRAFDVAVVSIVEIDPVIQLRRGFLDKFERSQFAANRDVRVKDYNAQGDSALINQIADKIAAERPDLVYALGTPVAQAIQKRSPDLLLVQGAVTDPITAGLADSWDGSGRQYVATSDLPPIEKQIDLIHDVTPMVRRLGVLYNPGESNSAAVLARLRDVVKTEGANMVLVERPIANTADVAGVMQSLLGNVDAVYVPPDNTAYSAVEIIGRIAEEHGLPLFATTADAIRKGALATLSLDHYRLGEETAELALRVLAGLDPRTIPIKKSDRVTVTISRERARKMGLNIRRFEGQKGVKIVGHAGEQ